MHPARALPSVRQTSSPGWLAYSPFPSRLFLPPRHGVETYLLIWLGITIFAGAIVIFDIAYNMMTVSSIGLFLLFGLRMDRANVPLLFFLILYNIAGLMALQPHLDFAESRDFMIGTCYVAVTAVFYCLVLNENAIARLEAIKWGLIAGGLVASIAGIVGYLRIAGLDAYFVMHGSRASGTFRDPNVLGSFLVLPALFLLNDLVRGMRGWALKAALAAPIILAILLSFSRGSWAAMVIGAGILCLLNAITARDSAVRARLALFSMIAVACGALALAAILSIDSIYEAFADRFTLQKDYDSGPSGRFGNQLRSLPVLLDLPFGFGPNRFWIFYTENPHNTFIMAFASYGWLGGISFLAFTITTVVISFKTCMLRTPFQPYAIVVFSALIPHIVQNFQIDTDRWRHLFLIYGLSWGLAAISRRWLSEYRSYAHQAYRDQKTLASGYAPAGS
ncbi:RfaL Lipid A core - O-antigen ligase and related enzymes [Rhabdaerophilaceae bacterium]